jgi:hypothetical protein
MYTPRKQTLNSNVNHIVDTNTTGNISLSNGFSKTYIITQPTGGNITSDRNITLPTAPNNNDTVCISILDEVFEGSHSFRYAVKTGITDLFYIDRRTSVELIYNTTLAKWIQVR